MLVGVDDISLIQICKRTFDSDSIQILLEKMNSAEAFLNLETLLDVISFDQTKESRRILSNKQIVRGELDEQARELLPLRGEIKQEYVFSGDKNVTTDLIDIGLSMDLDVEHKPVVIERHSTKIYPNLGSDKCQRFLEVISDAPDESLQVPQTTIVVESMWQKYRTTVLAYSMFQASHFALLAAYIIYGMASEIFSVIIGVASVVMIVIEAKQFVQEGLEYFANIWNCLDLTGNTFVIWHVYLTVFGGKKIWEQDKEKLILMTGICSIGLRAVSQMRIFKPYRVLIEMFRSTIMDMRYFMVILMYMIFLFTLLLEVLAVNKESDLVALRQMLPFHLLERYKIMFGDESGDDAATEEKAVYILFVYLVNVVSLNLLIAIISQTFSEVQAQLDSYHCRTKAQILFEIGTFMTLSRDSNQASYLFIFRYANEKVGGDQDSTEELLRDTMEKTRQTAEKMEGLGTVINVEQRRLKAEQHSIQSDMGAMKAEIARLTQSNRQVRHDCSAIKKDVADIKDTLNQILSKMK